MVAATTEASVVVMAYWASLRDWGPEHFARDLDRYRQATPERVRDAARQYLRPDRRVVLSVVPRGRAADALPGSEPVAVS